MPGEDSASIRNLRPCRKEHVGYACDGRSPAHPLFSGMLFPVLALLFWWIGSRLGLWNAFLLPSPEAVLAAAWKLTRNGQLPAGILSSTLRIVAGFGASCALALPLGVLLGLRPAWGRLFYPTLEFLRHVPPLALLPLLIL